ncbi:hypothetical protein [Thermospira aquatica]|uniref:DUF304 domain-containing protein n=1 Tax=Thermospira aquatica TaxID=2828656 RepID=A0AAX3BB71_9SPIR|nr:hypothetical protein [Thermospira aquatica]URA09473.1 hypothetical protein KDW03_08220 [Thermospira aquatica]
MLLKPFLYPSFLLHKRVLWLGLSGFIVFLGIWYSLAVSVPSFFILFVWGIILFLGLWSVFSTPLWIFSPRTKTITRLHFFQTRRWDFQEIQLTFLLIEHKDWQNRLSVYYLLTLRDPVDSYVIGFLNAKEIDVIQSLANHYHIPLEVKQ